MLVQALDKHRRRPRVESPARPEASGVEIAAGSPSLESGAGARGRRADWSWPGARGCASREPDKVYFPELGATKFDLVSYYLEVGDHLLNATMRRAAPPCCNDSPRGPPASPSTRSASPAGATGLAAVGHRLHTQRHHLQRTGGGRRCPRPVGRQPGLPGPARLAVPRRRSRRTPTSCASSPRPHEPASASTRCRAVALLCRDVLRLKLGPAQLPEDHREQRAAGRTSGLGRSGLGRACAAAVAWPSGELVGGGFPDLITANWWKDMAAGSSSTSTRAAPHKTAFGAGFALAPHRRAGPRRRSRGRRSRRWSPTS